MQRRLGDATGGGPSIASQARRRRWRGALAAYVLPQNPAHNPAQRVSDTAHSAAATNAGDSWKSMRFDTFDMYWAFSLSVRGLAAKNGRLLTPRLPRGTSEAARHGVPHFLGHFLGRKSYGPGQVGPSLALVTVGIPGDLGTSGGALPERIPGREVLRGPAKRFPNHLAAVAAV